MFYSSFSTHSTYINVPRRLAKSFRKDKPMWDLLVLAICLKLNKTNSGIYVRTPRDIMRVCRCSYRKADRLIKQAIQCSKLFRYNPKTKFLSANTFVKGCDYYFNDKGKKYYYDDCFKIALGKDGIISHNELSKQLRDKLILKPIRYNQPRMSYNSLTHRPEMKKKPLTQRYLANIAGCHRTTVSRHLRKLEQKGDISIISHDKFPIYDFDHDVEVNKMPKNRWCFLSGRVAYIRDVNQYKILNERINNSFQHIIYNHKKRLTDNKVYHHWEL